MQQDVLHPKMCAANYNVSLITFWSTNGEKNDRSFDASNGRPSRCTLPLILVMTVSGVTRVYIITAF